MTGPLEPMRPHLSDAEIDLYGAGRLEDAGLRALEEHFLDCAACRVRVERVVDLVEGLATVDPEPASAAPVSAPSRRDPALFGLAAAAALFAALSIGLAVSRSVESRRLALSEERRHRAEQRAAEAEALATRPTAEPLRGEGLAVQRFALAAPERQARAPRLVLDGAPNVLLAIDAREAAPPATRVELRVRRVDGPEVARLDGLEVSGDGIVSVLLPAAVLVSGPHVVEVRAPGETLAIPFDVVR